MNPSSRIKVYLLGGLGNQLFGASFAQSLNFNFPGKIIISDRLIPFGSNPKRYLMLDQFPIDLVSNLEIQRSSKRLSALIRSSSFIRRLMWHSYRMTPGRTRINLKEFFEFERIPLEGFDVLDYCNDWFFAEYNRHSNQWGKFFPNSNLIPTEFLDEIANGIVCHVRIGDYLNYPQTYQLLHENYYLRAIELLKHKCNDSKQGVVIVTESKAELKRFYPNLASGARIIGKEDLQSDMIAFSLMANAKRLVAANSTFSLWAAWFGLQNRDETVVPDLAESELRQDGLRELNWTILNPLTGKRVANEDYATWYKTKLTNFHETIQRLKTR